VQHHRLDRGWIDFPRPSRDFSVAKTVEREARLPLLGAATAQGVVIRGLRIAQRTNTKLTVFQHLGVADGDRGARGTLDGEPQATDQILTEIEDRFPAR